MVIEGDGTSSSHAPPGERFIAGPSSGLRDHPENA